MNFNLLATFNVSYCPSVIELINSENKKFIIGTYELVTQESDGLNFIDLEGIETKNNRLGSLILFQEKIIYELKCLDGGVFDLKVISTYKGCDLVYTAHSNGTFAIYQILDQLIQLKQKIITKCSFLTSIVSVNYATSKNITLIGDDKSHLLMYQSCELQTKLKLTQSDYPIWCIALRKLEGDEFLVVAGSDDSKIRFLKTMNGKLNLISSQTVSSSGVTSIAFASRDLFLNCKFIDDNIFIGSYDEHISIFHFVYDYVNSFPIQVTPKKSIHIQGSGIWKMTRVNINPSQVSFLITAMYSIAHILDNDEIIYSFKQLEDDDANQGTHLVYGASADYDCNYLLLSSFYLKKLYYYKKC